MSWLELDDRILEHPKFIRAVKLGGSEAVHLWLGIRAYCGQFLTDGFVPVDMVDEVRGPREPKKRSRALSVLVDVGLIETESDGVRMHDFLEWSRSKEEITEIRARSARRTALRSNPSLMKDVKERDRDRCRYCGVTVDWKDHRSPTGGTYDHVIPMSSGGGDGIDNIVTACRKCNFKKGARSPSAAGMTLLPVGTTGSSPPTVPVSDPLRSDPHLSSPGEQIALAPAVIWNAGEWLKRFGIAWAAHYQQLAYGQPGDSRACPSLGDVLSAMPVSERLAAQAKAPEMFAEFLGRTDHRTVERRHPFAFFVQEWGGLRVPKKPVTLPENFAERDARAARERAERERRSTEAAVAATEQKLSRDRNFTPPTPEQQEEIRRHLADLAEKKSAVA